MREHRERALTPDRPVLRGTAQNPDVFFQAREFYDACPAIVEKAMEQFAALTGRRYRLFDYVGDPRAERLIVIMGSGAETVDETVQYLTEQGEKVGVIKVRLFRPFSGAALLAALPSTTRSIAVLDRTKEPGAVGDPLYLDVVTALAEARADGKLSSASEMRVLAGRYGLSSKEFTPAMVKAIFDELAKERPRNHFTIGIVDDVTHTSLVWDPSIRTEAEDVDTALFYGLGADGTVGANKNSIKIIGEETDRYVQGYFVYDSKKSGAITISHLRASPLLPPCLPHHQRQVCRLSSVRVRRQDRRARARRSRCGVPAERSGSPARRVGAPAARAATADDREKESASSPSTLTL